MYVLVDSVVCQDIVSSPLQETSSGSTQALHGYLVGNLWYMSTGKSNASIESHPSLSGGLPNIRPLRAITYYISDHVVTYLDSGMGDVYVHIYNNKWSSMN
jgi:hypothetical protein